MSQSEAHQAVALEQIRQRLTTCVTELGELAGWLGIDRGTQPRDIERISSALELVERVRAARFHPTVVVERPAPSRVIKIRSDEEAI